MKLGRGDETGVIKKGARLQKMWRNDGSRDWKQSILCGLERGNGSQRLGVGYIASSEDF